MTPRDEDAVTKIRRVHDSVAAEPVEARTAGEVLGEPLATRTPSPAPLVEAPETETPALPGAPDGAPVNETWDIRRALAAGGLLHRWLVRLAAPLVEAQVTFNSRQVQLDNEVLTFLPARLDGIHRQYDTVLGIYGRHIEDINARHLILQEELVAHVHDLVRRIDLTLAEGERTRLSLEAEVRELRARVRELEARLGGGR